MKNTLRALLVLTCICYLCAPPLTFAQSRNREAREKEKEKKEEAEEIRYQGQKTDLDREFKALDEAYEILKGVNDEASAKKAATKISELFNPIPPQDGTQRQGGMLEKLANKQNLINDAMMKLTLKPYFKSSGLQEAWALVCDPIVRRSHRKRSR